MLPPPVVLAKSAKLPTAVLTLPEVLLKSASKPMDVLPSPSVLLTSAVVPVAVLKLPVVLFKSAAVANGGVLGSLTRNLISDVEKKRSRTQSGVVAPVSVAPERKPAHCRIPHAGGEVEQGVLPFRRVESGIAAVWRRDNRLRLAGATEARQDASAMRSDGVAVLR